MEGEVSAAPLPSAPEDAVGFADWVLPHVAVLTALAARAVAAADIDDVVQEALVRAWQRRTTFDPARGTPRAWLIGVLYDRARRHRVRLRPAVSVDRGVAVEPAAEARLEVEQAVAALPRRQREVITLHYLADLTVVETARVLGISNGSVKSALHDARLALHTRLEDT